MKTKKQIQKSLNRQLSARNPLQNVDVEPRSDMESPSSYPVSYAITAVDFSKDKDGWKKSNIFQLFPSNQKTQRNSNTFKILKFAQKDSNDIERRQLHSSLADSALTGLPDNEKYEFVTIVQTNPFVGSKTGASTDVLFAIVPRDSAVNSTKDKGSTSNDQGPTRGFFRPDKDISTVSRLAGIIIDTFGTGDDLILPNGPGGKFDENSNEVNKYFKVDRNRTFVNTNDGDDVVIGGFSTDYFGPGKPSDLLLAKSNPRSYKADTTSSGSKVFVGGSESDLLIGGKDDDYLVGDSFATMILQDKRPLGDKRLEAANNYLTTKAAKVGGWQQKLAPIYDLSDLPETQRFNIQAYQPEYFLSYHSLIASHERFLNSAYAYTRTVDRTKYPMWIPGNDVIYGGAGNDTIFGDDNTFLGSGSNLLPLVRIQQWGKGYNAKDGVHLLKQDEIDSGVRWPSLFKANAEKGTLGSDFINAGPGSDYISAGFGEDAIIGGADGDVIGLGPQIAVQGYTPFFGTKVAFGDDATFDPILQKWIKASERYIDNFIVGDIYFDESELGVGEDIPTPMNSALETHLASMESINGAFAKASGLISKIPEIGSIVAALTGASLKFFLELASPPAPDYNKAANAQADASDKISIIRDFDSFDTLTIRTKSGDILSTARQSNVAFSGKSKLFDGKGDRYIANGTKIQQSITNNGQVIRIFLEDYHESMFVLGSVDSELSTNGITQKYTTWTIGGSSYGGLPDTSYFPLN